MRSLIDLIEMYSSQNTYALQALKNTDFDYYNHWWEICNWAEETDNLDAFGDFESAEQLHEEDASLFEHIPEYLQKEASETILHNLMRHDPAEVPSSEWFTPENKLIPRQTWLVHFTDHASAIIHDGFTKGMDDAYKLGLTTYFGDGAKQYGGYNFAFEAKSRYASFAASQKKYGKEAILFQSSGVKAWHSGDEEDQIIFWGPEVDKNSLIYIHQSHGDWYVLNKHSRPIIQGEFEYIVNWLIANYDQYRKALR